MEEITTNQLRKITILFFQNADKIIVKGRKKGEEKTVELKARVGALQLAELISNMGPYLPQEQIIEFIYEYDSSMTGTLDLFDFTELMKDFILVLRKARNDAIAYWSSEKINLSNDSLQEFNLAYPTVQSYLTNLGLEDPGEYLDSREEISEGIQKSFKIVDPNLLIRHLSIRIFAARGLDGVLRLKKREHDQIQFKSLDPYVRVQCAGMTKETSIIIGGTQPMWEQTIDFVIEIPTGVITDIQQWVQVQNVEFFLFDSNSAGNAVTSELVAYASVPLISILLSSQKPMNSILNLVRTGGTFNDQPVLEVSFLDLTLEKLSWAKVADSYLSNEEMWLMKYSDKMKNDLGAFALRKLPKEERLRKIISERIWNLFLSTLDSLKNLFPLRKYAIVFLDEFNVFRFASAFVRPIKLQNQQSMKLDEAALAVASIPFERPVVTPQFGTQKYVQNKTDGSATYVLASWNTKGSPGEFATETFMRQIASPSTMLVRRSGSLLEHAIFLCCVFRGKGIDSYVAIGEAMHRPYAWVITIIPKSELSSHFSEEIINSVFNNDKNGNTNSAAAMNGFDIVEYNYYNENFHFDTRKFSKVAQLSQELEFLEQNAVIHWDPLSGKLFLTQESVLSTNQAPRFLLTL